MSPLSTVPNTTHWYLVHTKIRQEQLALDHLQRQGFECFLPLISVEKRRRGALQVVQEPLFPRYLFGRTTEAAPSWGPMRSTLGVSRLVSFGADPAHIGHELVARLREQAQAAPVQRPQFTPGQTVAITHGPLAGLEAIFHMADADGRVMVLLHLLSRQVSVTLPPGSVS